MVKIVIKTSSVPVFIECQPHEVEQCLAWLRRFCTCYAETR